ncbi:hypothetical protein COLO4_11919 [Corchorus olitorius]|uniref:F-box domain-containing protein n=1 Tax=Corchorus olitorius TaxID=93759 RepID=A0A1R3K2V6_9ROSI|nr:hypothetical protein COLO4_11919 [Corchorus olitorius]
MAVAGDFPEDLTRDILLRIPVKSVSRFRCVHKTWDSLFNSSSFIITHFNNSNKKGHNFMMLMIPYDETVDKNWYLTQLRFRLFTRDKFNVYLNLEGEAPFRITSRNHVYSLFYPFVGFCNGLVCLHNYLQQPEQIVLYNPCLKQHKIIQPPIDFNVSEFRDRVLGFGYDSVNNDYKVVYWRKREGHGIRTQLAQVYTLGTNSWRDVDPPVNITFIKVPTNFQAFLNGSIHWWGKDVKNIGCQVIVSFKVCSEEFQVFHLPDYVPRPKRLANLNFDQIGIYVCRDLLCVSVATICDQYLNQSYDIWAMGRYGVQESWTRLFVVDNEQRPDPFSYFKGIEMNGELVWSRTSSTDRVWVTVNYADNEKFHDIKFGYDDRFPEFPVVTYTESLVSLK